MDIKRGCDDDNGCGGSNYDRFRVSLQCNFGNVKLYVLLSNASVLLYNAMRESLPALSARLQYDGFGCHARQVRDDGPCHLIAGMLVPRSITFAEDHHCCASRTLLLISPRDCEPYMYDCITAPELV